MSRNLAPLFLCAAWLVSGGAHARYVAGGIFIHSDTIHGSLRSSADVTVRHDNGTIDWEYQFQGFHNIYETGYGSSLLAGRTFFAVGTVATFVSGYGEVGVCYDARVVATGPGLYFERYDGSECLQEPPPNPHDDPFCEITWIGCSPIVIDLDSNGYHLTGLGDPVPFDLNNDGSIDTISWTRGRGETDAWLCLDRNRDGRITSGAELFGDSTLLVSGARAPNGFVALAEFDTASQGGNGDGWISERDRIFRDLCLWVDANHDGRSDAGELLPLTAGRVSSIAVNYVVTNWRDQHGNRFRYLSLAGIRNAAGRPSLIPIYDVLLRVQ